MAAINRFLSTLLILVIRFYRVAFSALWGPYCCRFEPTCSLYAMQAINSYGCLKGSFLMVGRVIRCHPFQPGGIDPVP